ncbi:hypothetical protein [Streptomyces sp. NPDC002078]
MPTDTYAVLRALLRAEARRATKPKPEQKHKEEPQRPSGERDR